MGRANSRRRPGRQRRPARPPTRPSRRRLPLPGGLPLAVVVLATATACGAIVAIAATDELDLLWIVVAADVVAALALAATVGLVSPLQAERPVLTTVLHGGGVVALAQLAAGVLAA